MTDSPTTDPTPTSLLAVARVLLGDDVARAAYLDDPATFLTARGLGDLTPDDLAAALPHVADALPPAVAAAMTDPSGIGAELVGPDPYGAFATLATLDVEAAEASWAELTAADPDDPDWPTEPEAGLALDDRDPADGLDAPDPHPHEPDPHAPDPEATGQGLDPHGLDDPERDPAGVDTVPPETDADPADPRSTDAALADTTVPGPGPGDVVDFGRGDPTPPGTGSDSWSTDPDGSAPLPTLGPDGADPDLESADVDAPAIWAEHRADPDTGLPDPDAFDTDTFETDAFDTGGPGDHELGDTDAPGTGPDELGRDPLDGLDG